ncbi:RNA polymerase sigma factor SigY [Paenibacillus gansuensis]|uniref:RNA polymerase sigma factor n=1 Tax=Paenibacillus gansuensis TaxID=306542 RepID=A0ABW5PK85_9BACL
MNEEQLIKQAQRGDTDALASLFREHYTFVLKYLTKVTLNPVWAEDLTQDTIVRAMEKISLYNGKSKFSSWLITIASRLMSDQAQRRKREKLWQEQEQSVRRLEWKAGHEQEDWPEVLNALGGLDHDMRMPLLLKHYYGYTYDEIGDMLGIPGGTAKSRVHHGIKLLRKEMDLR